MFNCFDLEELSIEVAKNRMSDVKIKFRIIIMLNCLISHCVEF